MNNVLEAFARKTLKEDLAQCTAGQRHRFKQMYAAGDLAQSADKVVDIMPVDQLDRAMEQVAATVKKKGGG